MKRFFLILFLFILIGAIAGSVYYFVFNQPTKEPISDTIRSVTNKITENNQDSNKAGTLLEVTPQDSFSISQITQSNNSFLSSTSRITPKYAVDRSVMRYESTDSKGETIEIRAQLFIPHSDANESFPIYVVGHGTTGLGDHCAPSQEQPSVSNWGNYIADMLSYASQGYIVVFPDYEGHNDPDRIHHYFNAQMEAQVLLDGTRAVFTHFKNENIPYEEAVFYGGYSQGGHAAFAVKDYASTYAPEIPIKGVMGFGGTTDMTALLKENPSLAPYLVYAYSDLYGEDVVNASEILLSQHVPTLAQDATTICVGGIYQKYGYDAARIYTPEFRSALMNNTLDAEYPEFKKVLDENNSGLKDGKIPALILQGSADPIVTVKSQKEFMEKLCTTDTPLRYIEYPGVHHYQTRQVSIRDTLAWMSSVADGTVPPSDCNNI